MSYSLEEVRVLAKREPFRAGVRMRFVMPRISVRVSRWLLNHVPAVTPNQLTAVSGLLAVVAAAFLLFPSGIAPAVAAWLLYQLHILFDYVDGEVARVKRMASPVGAYYDLMVGRLTKPVLLGCAAVGTWLAARPWAAARSTCCSAWSSWSGSSSTRRPSTCGTGPTPAAPTSRTPTSSGRSARWRAASGRSPGPWSGCEASRRSSATRSWPRSSPPSGSTS